MLSLVSTFWNDHTAQCLAWDLLNTRYYCWHYIETDIFASILEKWQIFWNQLFSLATQHSSLSCHSYACFPSSQPPDSWPTPGAASCLTPDPHLGRPPVCQMLRRLQTWFWITALTPEPESAAELGHPSGIPGFCVCQTSPASRDSRIVRRKQNSLIISLHTSQMSMTLCSDTW